MDTDFWDGLKDDIPICCIIWFCDVWKNLRTEHRMFSGRPECYDWRLKHLGYVPCPECMIKGVRIE